MTDTNIRKSRGRPRKFSKEMGVDCALKCFHKFGYDGVSIADLCKILNVPATSIYAAYGSKLMLFQLALDSYANTFTLGLENQLSGSDSVSDIFRKTLEYSLQQYAQSEDTPGCFFLDTTLCTKHQNVRNMTTDKTQLLTHILTKTLSELETQNSEELASTLVTLMRGLSNEVRMKGPSEELWITLEIMCSAFD